MIERVGMETSGESSTHKEVVRTIATGVNSLKSKLISMTNKNKKMWRAVAKNTPVTVTSLSREQLELEAGESGASPGRYNLRSTPTRQAAASRTQKQNANTTANLQQEEQTSSGSREELTNLTDESETNLKLTPFSDKNSTSVEAGGLRDTDTEVTTDTLTVESSTCEPDLQSATITVPVTDLERAKEMAQQLSALITNLEHHSTSALDSLKQ